MTARVALDGLIFLLGLISGVGLHIALQRLDRWLDDLMFDPEF